MGDSSVADLAALAPKADEYGYILPLQAELEGSDPWEECAVVLWSSGTTGRPKGILHREIMICHISNVDFWCNLCLEIQIDTTKKRLQKIDVPMHLARDTSSNSIF